MVKRSSLLAIALILCVVTAAGTSIAAQPQGVCVHAYFLAYNNETHRGSVVPARICVYRSSQPYVEIIGAKYNPSVLDSFLIALKTLGRFCSAKVLHLKVVVYFHGTNLYIEGASGSLLFALSILKIFNLTKFKDIDSATGVLSIDGFVDPVGAVSYKLAAAHSSGIRIVLVPLLNYASVRNTSLKPRVIYVDTVLDLCSNATIVRPVNPLGIAINRTLVDEMYKVLRRDITRFVGMANKTMVKLPAKARARLEKTYREFMKVIRTLINEGHIYSAASQSFGLYVTIANASLSYTNISYLSKLVDRALNIVNNIYDSLEKSKSISVNAIPFVLVLLNRIKVTVFYANLFRNVTIAFPHGSPPLSKLASLVSYTYGRSLTSETWYRLLKLANSSGGPYLPSKVVLDASWKVLNLVSGMIELGRAYSPLSLDTIANTRGYLALVSRNSSLEERVLKDLRILLNFNLKSLTPTQRIIPYFYTLYANDLRRLRNASLDTEITFYSLANLIASATLNVLQVINESSSYVTQSWTPSKGFAYATLCISSAIAAATTLLALLTLKVIEKRLRTSTTTASV